VASIKVIQATETLPIAPHPIFTQGFVAPWSLSMGRGISNGWSRDDRVRACYQHWRLKWVMAERMTNQSLPRAVHLPEAKSADFISSALIEPSLNRGGDDSGNEWRFGFGRGGTARAGIGWSCVRP